VGWQQLLLLHLAGTGAQLVCLQQVLPLLLACLCWPDLHWQQLAAAWGLTQACQ
jgi:hypothetical protein